MPPKVPNSDSQIAVSKDDLHPDDRRARAIDGNRLRIRRITAISDPLFETAYRLLWDEFGEKGEVEEPSVLASRMAWNAAEPKDGFFLKYELMAIELDGELAAIRDQSAIRKEKGIHQNEVVIHLSHVLLFPKFRGSGLSGWLWTLPLSTGRACFAESRGTGTPIYSLVAEMEPLDLQISERIRRLKAIARSGFRRVDPAVIEYLQPDFRKPEVIDKSGGPRPLPLWLVLRRLGAKSEDSLTASQVRHIVESLYSMYAQGFRKADMDAVWKVLFRYPQDEARIALLRPFS